MTEIKEMQIECPSCSTANKIEYAENIICQKCKKNFLGYIFKKKAFISASTAFVAGILGTYHIEKYIYDTHRYPIKFEYEAIDACINSSNSVLDRATYQSKALICICAMEKTSKEISYKEVKGNGSIFPIHFRRSISTCY